MHRNIPQKEKVDQLAKEAAQTQKNFKFAQQTISISKLEQLTKVNLKTPTPITYAQQKILKLKTFLKVIIEQLDKLYKGLAEAIHQLLTVHVPVNKYLHTIKRMEKPVCKNSNTHKTPIH
ncbi:hypothetical protein O181_020996 [Austropuccinia psidii MF-1]|uniref:Uncharacterized protein n=1 Tax=Austropuccinia psidii MF-1 TaxID=1389203 RepID=A0A9Q3CEK7_9BASI|nr:hypothetical protein [Austropuccinia psidii MF-1]